MKKGIAKKIISIIIILFILSGIITVPVFAVNSNIVSDDTASYFKLYYNSKNGLPDDIVYDIATTPDGYLWYATASGLVRYDGNNFKLINKNNEKSFPAVDVRCLFVDSNGDLWIGTADANVICKSDDGYKQYGKSLFNGSGAVKDIEQLNDGTIAVATSGGVYFVNSDGNVIELDKPEDAFIQANSLTVNTDKNTLICVTETGKIAIISNGKLVNYESYKQTQNGSVTCMCYLGNDIFRTGMSNGTVIDADLVSNKKIKEYSTDLGAIKSIYPNVNGACVILGAQGIGSIDGNGKYSENEFFGKSVINSLCVDFQGNYWFAVENKGVLEMGKSTFLNINEEYGLPDNYASCVIEYKNILYLGTKEGLIAIDKASGNVITNELTRALEGKAVNDLEISTEDRIIVATEDYGVYAYGWALGLKHYTKKDHLIDDDVNTVCVMGDLYISLGYDDGLSIDVNKKIVNEFNEENGVAGTVVKIYKTELTGELLVGTESNGGYRITKEGKSVPFENAENLSGSIIKAIIDSKDKKGVWIGYGSELYYYTSVSEYKKIDKLQLTHNIVDMFHDQKGKLWIVTSDKIVIADEENLIDDSSQLNVDTLCKNDGLVSDVLTRSYNYMSDNGELYLCTGSGVLMIDTNNYTGNKTQPRLAVDYIYADGETVTQKDGQFQLEPETDVFEIGITAISFYLDRDYNLMYKLDDAGYVTSSLSDANKIVYNKINGGEHTIEIKLIDNETNDIVSKKEIKLYKEYSVTEIKVFRFAVAACALVMTAPLIYLFLWYRVYRNKKKHKRALAIAEQAMHSFARVIDAKDTYTKGHSERVAEYTVEIAKRYGVSEERQRDLYYSALLHDIGKVGIPDSILKKPSRLTDEEYELMKTHTTVGAKILEDMPIVKNIQFGARDHHERYDGTGYPRGLKGTLISFEGRIIGAADAYDAMTTLRGYNSTRSHEEIKKEISELAGKQFDPEIAKIITDMIDEGYFAPPEENTEKLAKKKKFTVLKKYKKNYRNNKRHTKNSNESKAKTENKEK